MLADLVLLVRRPLQALRTIELDRSLFQGLIGLSLSVVLPGLVSELAGLAPFRPPAQLGSLPSLTAQGADLYARWSYQNRFLLPMYGILISAVLWVLAVLLIHGIARALRGQGDFRGFLRLAGYIALLGLVALPVGVLDALARIQGDATLAAATGQLTGVVAVGILLWQNLLLIYAARLHYRISTERAVAAVVGPIGGVVVIGLALVVVAAILFVVSQQA